MRYAPAHSVEKTSRGRLLCVVYHGCLYGEGGGPLAFYKRTGTSLLPGTPL
jgi:hypothetical protein